MRSTITGLANAHAAPGSVRTLLALWLWVCWPPLANADWINLTGAETAANIAEIYVLDDRVRLVLEVYVRDLEVFEALVPDDWLNDGGAGRAPLEARMRDFAESTFQVVTGSGETLSATLDVAEPRMRVDRKSPFAGMMNPFTRQRVPEAPADKRVLYAEISYPFRDRPEELVFVPPMDAEGIPRVTIGFIAYHKSVPIIDFRYLGAPARLALDWDDPWYTKFDNPNLKRHHKDALMSFLYVEPFEVRHEILVRVKEMSHWMDLGLRGDTYIETDELPELKQRIGEYLMSRNPLSVDGEALKPILDRTSFVTVGLNGIQLLEQPERLEISSAIVGVIITYLTDALPQQVTVDWELFTDQIQRVPATAVDPAGPLATYVEPEDNVHTWTNFLKNYQPPTVARVEVRDTLGTLAVPMLSALSLMLLIPLLVWWRIARRKGRSALPPLLVMPALLLVSWVTLPYLRVEVARPMLLAPDLDAEQADVLLEALVGNIYRAFDFREEEDVYDKLSVTVSGDLLADIYLQNRKSFAVQRAGGAQAKVKQVDVQSASAVRLDGGDPGYRLRGRWTATGTVGHWGHVHTRTNQYEAELTVVEEDGHWKIVALDLLDEQRLDPASGRPAGSPAAPAS